MQTIQRESAISFPMLGGRKFCPPSYFTLFGRDVYYYGVIVALAFVAGTLYCSKKSRRFGIKEDDVYDVLLWMIPFSIIGARIYFVLFQFDYYRSNPREIFAVWEGGLAIYGGIIAGIAVVLAVCWRKRIPAPAMLDLFITGCILGQAIGRWGNFINREAFGGETDIFCRMGLTSPDGSTIYVHPTFLYESLWNLAGFIILDRFISSGRRKYDGQCLLIYFLWYGAGRAWIEGLRTDSLYIPSTGIRVSQVLSVLLAAVSAALLIINGRKQRAEDCLYVNRAEAEAEAKAEAETEASGNTAGERKAGERKAGVSEAGVNGGSGNG